MGRHCVVTTSSGMRVVVSEALIRAHKYESEVAIFLRVVIDPDVLKHLGPDHSTFVVKDRNDYIVHFANYIVNREGRNLNKVELECIDIANARDGATCARVKEKHQWLLDYYCWTITNIPDADVTAFLRFASSDVSRFSLCAASDTTLAGVDFCVRKW